MSMPDVFMFAVNNKNYCKIIAIVAMSEEEAFKEVEDEYSTCYIELLENISIQHLGVMKEIYRIDR